MTHADLKTWEMFDSFEARFDLLSYVSVFALLPEKRQTDQPNKW